MEMRLDREQRNLAQEALKDLVGLPLSDMWRYGCQKFEFGEQHPQVNRKGEVIHAAEWALVAECPWRLSGPAGFEFSHQHFGLDLDRRDDHAANFYKSLETSPPVVTSIAIASDGRLTVAMGDFVLVMVPSGEDTWRFMPPKDDPRGHFEVGENAFGWTREA